MDYLNHQWTFTLNKLSLAENELMDMKLDKVLSRLLRESQESPKGLSLSTCIPLTTLKNWLNGVQPSGKNLHHIFELCEFFDVSITEILFDQDKSEKKKSEVLFSSIFRDNETKYKITVKTVSYTHLTLPTKA